MVVLLYPRGNNEFSKRAPADLKLSCDFYFFSILYQ